MKQIIWTLCSPAPGRALKQHWLHLLMISGELGMEVVQLFWPSWTFQWLSTPLTSCPSGTAPEVGSVKHNVMVALLLPPWLFSLGGR